MIKLRCGCVITEEGQFKVSVECSGCKECNTISQLHPFGDKRLD